MVKIIAAAAKDIKMHEVLIVKGRTVVFGDPVIHAYTTVVMIIRG